MGEWDSALAPVLQVGVWLGSSKLVELLRWDNSGSQAAGKQNIVKILKGVRGILEKMCFANYRSTVQTIVTALRSPH